MCMILLDKKILSFPSIKKWLDPPGSYKNSTGQKTSNTRQQEARKNLIDLLTSGMSNLTCYYFNNPRNIQLSAVTSANSIPHILRATLTILRKGYHFFQYSVSPIIATPKKVFYLRPENSFKNI